MAGRAVGVIGMLTLAVPLPVSPASADPIRITGGSMIAEVRQGDEVGVLMFWARKDSNCGSAST